MYFLCFHCYEGLVRWQINQGKTLRQSLLAKHVPFWEMTLTLLCCILCIRILRVRIFKGYHAKVTLIGFNQPIVPSQTQHRLCLPFMVLQTYELLGSGPLFLLCSNFFILNSASAYTFNNCYSMVILDRFRKTMRPSQTQRKICLPFLVLQIQTFLKSDSLTLLCSNFCFWIRVVSSFKVYHTKVTLVRFKKNDRNIANST